ncbi:hypothetical protein [Gordonia neofelifaecis]|uniref:YcxB-like protein domain-containing protein n=1 Tax=Gordonia neofelifaecis NRRL B-59395 TaxID=644548 RepID=F1YLL2_9ACTN|nr:hypothetical protein [Gordonia neofelifaecis]EGD54406.1 hypothetical protein SCNU_14019 [Gordonia neofelifaecis NRRL B-59395]
MAQLIDDVPDLTYHYTFVEGDRRKLEKAAMIVWLRWNPGLWAVMAFETALVTFLSVMSGDWWWLTAIPLILMILCGANWSRTRRQNRQVDPGNQIAVGVDDHLLRVVDSTGQIVFPYRAFKAVHRLDGWVGLKFKKGRVLLLPVQVCPPELLALVEKQIGG